MSSTVSERIVDVIVAAAGSGRRLGASVPKAFLEVAGAPLVAHALGPLTELSPRRVLVAVPPPSSEPWSATLESCHGLPVHAVVGGASRQASVRAALEALQQLARSADQPFPDLVLVHDAARPCASVALWRRVEQAAGRAGAAIPVLAPVDCLKRLDEDGRVSQTIDGEGLVRVQTPQGFRFDWLWEAHEAADSESAPDDAALLERLGHSITTVPGELANVKVTTDSDLGVVAAYLAERPKSRA